MARPTLRERFDAKWLGEPNSGCWLWEGYLRGGTPKRPSINVNGRMTVAARVAHELYTGPIPAGLLVLHKCDTPICVNPNHLFVGTQEDNMRDCLDKGRFADRERHSRAKLTWDAVREIREGGSRKRLAAKYGVSIYTIASIRAGYAWREKPDVALKEPKP